MNNNIHKQYNNKQYNYITNIKVYTKLNKNTVKIKCGIFLEEQQKKKKQR